MIHTFSEFISPILWIVIAVFWVVAAVILFLAERGKATLFFLIFCALSLVLSVVSTIDAYSYHFSDQELISYGTPVLLIYELGWMAVTMGQILALAFIAFRLKALIQRTNELEQILQSKEAS